jgi:uncharacterized membrane protein
MLSTIRDIIAYGCLGILIETMFTGIGSMVRGNIAGTSKTYIWMLPIYGIAGSIIVYINTSLIDTINIAARSLINVLLIFSIEMTSGVLLERLIGVCPWKYMDEYRPHMTHRFSVLGLIRLDYTPYWYVLALAFDYNTPRIVATLNFLSHI